MGFNFRRVIVFSSKLYDFSFNFNNGFGSEFDLVVFEVNKLFQSDIPLGIDPSRSKKTAAEAVSYNGDAADLVIVDCRDFIDFDGIETVIKLLQNVNYQPIIILPHVESTENLKDIQGNVHILSNITELPKHLLEIASNGEKTIDFGYKESFC